MNYEFKQEYSWMRARNASLEQRVASAEVGPALIGLIADTLNQQRTFMTRWWRIGNKDAKNGIAHLAATISRHERHTEALFLLYLTVLMEVRRVLHEVGVNHCSTERTCTTEEKESDGQLSFAYEGEVTQSESGAFLARAQQEYDRALRELLEQWPEKVNAEFPDRLELYDPGDFPEWTVEIQEKLVRLCLDSDFPVKERTKALRIIACLA